MASTLRSNQNYKHFPLYSFSFIYRFERNKTAYTQIHLNAVVAAKNLNSAQFKKLLLF